MRLLLATVALLLAAAAAAPAATNVELLHGTVRSGAHSASGSAAVVLTVGQARPDAAPLPHRARPEGPRLPRAALGQGRRRRAPRLQGPRRAEGQQGQPAVRDPRQRRPAPLPQRDLLVRAVHVDARAGEPHAVMSPLAQKLLAPPLVVADARRRRVVLVGRRRARLLDGDRLRRRVVRRLQRDLRPHRQGAARAAPVAARHVPRLLGGRRRRLLVDVDPRDGGQRADRDGRAREPARAAELGGADPLAPQPETPREGEASRAATSSCWRAPSAAVPQRVGARAGRQARERRAQAHAVGRLSRSIPARRSASTSRPTPSGATFKDLGGLKGSKGTQQYKIAASIEPVALRHGRLLVRAVLRLARERGPASPPERRLSGGRRRWRPAGATPRRAT